MFYLVHTTCFWNNLHQVCHKVKSCIAYIQWKLTVLFCLRQCSQYLFQIVSASVLIINFLWLQGVCSSLVLWIYIICWVNAILNSYEFISFVVRMPFWTPLNLYYLLSECHFELLWIYIIWANAILNSYEFILYEQMPFFILAT